MKIITSSIAATFLVGFQLLAQYGNPENIELQVKEGENKVDVLVNNQLFTSYIYPKNLKKPVLWPVMSAGGNMVTRSYPMINRVGDRVDHPHQVGVWLNYGDVNGLDFWNNSESVALEKSYLYGTIYHGTIEKSENGKKATLVTTASWNSPDGHVLLTEESIFEFQAQEHLRIIDRNTKLTAIDTAVSFNDHKEGMFAIRVARELELPTENPTQLMGPGQKIIEAVKIDNQLINGNYQSANGVEGKGVWGTRSRWMKLSGKINNEIIEIIIIDHPSNPGYPTYWHARDYGLFSANTLGQKVFSNGENELNFALGAGESVRFKYRLVIASEHLTRNAIDHLADEFAE